MRRYWFIIGFLLAVVSLAQSPPAAKTDSPDPDWFHIGHYGDVRALCRAGDSLWVGTGGGLFIYHTGASEVVDHVTIGSALPSNSVRSIAVREDSVYVGTDGGLSIFVGDTALVFTASSPGRFDGAPLDQIRQIDFGLDGLVYLSTYGLGLGVLGCDTAWSVTRADSLLDDKVFGMVQEDDTTFYFATSTGLCAYRDSAWVNFRAGAGLPRAEIRQIEAAPEGGLYLLVGGRGIYWFDGERSRRVTGRGQFVENSIAAMVVDARGDLWACGDHGGLSVYRNGHWSEYDTGRDDLARRRWRSAAAGPDGSVYFGSAEGFVLMVHDEIEAGILLPEGLPSAGVRVVEADSSGALYVLNGSYLLRIDGALGTFSLEHPSPVVADLAMSPAGELYTATRWGIFRREGDRYVDVDAQISEREPVFCAIGFDLAGSMWAGTQAGNVHRFDGEIWMRMGDSDELKIGAARSFAPDGMGRLWVTGANGGVASYFRGRWTVYGPPAYGDRPARQVAVAPSGIAVLATDSGVWGLGDDGIWMPVDFRRAASPADSSLTDVWDPGAPSILTLEFDPAGRLFVGTEGGIAIIDDDGTRWITPSDGLRGGAVTSLFATGGGELWVGFRSDGLARIPVGPGPPRVGEN